MNSFKFGFNDEPKKLKKYWGKSKMINGIHINDLEFLNSLIKDGIVKKVQSNIYEICSLAMSLYYIEGFRKWYIAANMETISSKSLDSKENELLKDFWSRQNWLDLVYNLSSHP